MRQKRNKNSRERLEQVCKGPVFQHLPKYDVNFLDRIKIVTGDLSQPRMGIQNNDILNELTQTVEIVIHAAADVRFNEPLYNLVCTNLIGTRDLLELSRKMTKLQVFVYMSTAFSNTKVDGSEHIEEKFYEPPMDADILIDFVRTHKSEADQDLLNMIAPNLIEPWPNNYTFSKALSESVVRRYGNDFPIAVIRPTISNANYTSLLISSGSKNRFCMEGSIYLKICRIRMTETTFRISSCGNLHERKFSNNKMIGFSCQLSTASEQIQSNCNFSIEFRFMFQSSQRTQTQ